MIAIEEVVPWLNMFEPGHISASSGHLISQVRKALEEGHRDEAGGLLQQLYDLAYKLQDGKEVTEILVECGYSSFVLESLAQAESILEDCVSRAWSDIHRRSVIRWMLGCVQWQSLSTRQQAVISWSNSVSDFKRLAKKPSIPSQQRTWYEDTCRLLERNLVEAVEDVGSYMDLVQSTGETDDTFEARLEQVSSIRPASPASETQTSTGLMRGESTMSRPFDILHSSETPVTFSSDILQLFTISEEIPAGDFGPSGIDPFPIGTVEIDHVTINGHAYSIHSTRGRKIINLPLDQKFSVVKVKGDSMDQDNITEKDYVLLRKVDAPAISDIVMAEIVGIDSHATLKRYSREKDSISLSPHSSNPVHKPFVFKNVNEGFYIRGVVMAILKPM